MAEAVENQRRGGAGAVAVALAAGCLFGLGGALSQVVARDGFTVLQVCFVQHLCAVVILGVLVAVKWRPRGLTRSDVLKLIAIGAMNAFATLCYYLAIERLSVAAGVAVQFQYVWIAVIIQSVLQHTLPKKWTVVSAVLIVGGTVFGSGVADEIASGAFSMDPLGFVFAFACACCYAIFLHVNGLVAADRHPITRTFFQVIGGLTLMTAILATAGSGFGFDFARLLPGGALLAVVMSVAPLACLAAASSRLPGGILAILASSELPAAVIAGALLLDEHVTPFVAFGVVVIVGAIALGQLDNRGPAQKTVP